MNIIGVSGTLGDLNDQEILEKNYKVKIFRVPRDKPRIKPIYIKERPNNIDELFNLIYQEIQYETGKGRPVLVIMDHPKRVDSFVNLYGNIKRSSSVSTSLSVSSSPNKVDTSSVLNSTTFSVLSILDTGSLSSFAYVFFIFL